MRNRLSFANQRGNNRVNTFQLVLVRVGFLPCLGITLFRHRVGLVRYVVVSVTFAFSALIAHIANIRRLLENRAGRVVVLVAKFSAIKVKAPDTFAFAVKVAAKILFLTFIGKPAVIYVRFGSFCRSSIHPNFFRNRSSRYTYSAGNFG